MSSEYYGFTLLSLARGEKLKGVLTVYEPLSHSLRGDMPIADGMPLTIN